VPVTVFTIGHSTRTIAEFVALLAQVAVESVVDVRSIPRSRTNPQFNADILPGSLAEAGMTYRHLRTLGGRRQRSQDQTPSPNTLWRNESFRNYADYAASEAFRAGLDELEALARRQCCAVMCGAPWKGAIPQWEGSPTRQLSLQPVAIGAVVEETKRPKPSV